MSRRKGSGLGRALGLWDVSEHSRGKWQGHFWAAGHVRGEARWGPWSQQGQLLGQWLSPPSALAPTSRSPIRALAPSYPMPSGLWARGLVTAGEPCALCNLCALPWGMLASAAAVHSNPLCICFLPRVLHSGATSHYIRPACLGVAW